MTEPEVADVHTIEVDSAAAPAPGACMNDAAHFIEPVPPLVEKPMPPELARWTSLTYVDGAGTVCTTMASDGAKIEHFPGTRRTDPETGFAEPDPTIEEEAPPPTPAAAERRETEAVRQVMPASLSPATTAAATEQQPKPPPSLQAPRPRSRKPSKTTIPLDEKDQALCLGIQDKELRFLVRLYKAGRQERGEPFVSQADMIQQWGINRDILYETDELGRMIGYTPEKDEFIGHNALGRGATTYKRKGQFVTIPPEQFLKRVTPGSETPAQTKARRAKSKRQYRSERERHVHPGAGPPPRRDVGGSQILTAAHQHSGKSSSPASG
jgi:hypothetical protein